MKMYKTKNTDQNKGGVLLDEKSERVYQENEPIKLYGNVDGVSVADKETSKPSAEEKPARNIYIELRQMRNANLLISIIKTVTYCSRLKRRVRENLKNPGKVIHGKNPKKAIQSTPI